MRFGQNRLSLGKSFILQNIRSLTALLKTVEMVNGNATHLFEGHRKNSKSCYLTPPFVQKKAGVKQQKELV